MTSTDTGFLWLVDENGVSCEILNDDRARHYQKFNPVWNGATDCDACECLVLRIHPCTGEEDNDTYRIEDEAPSGTEDPAPWFDDTVAASAEFLGFIAESVDGFDYAHYARTVNQRSGDGANLTPLRAGGREVTYTLWATALSEAGMNWGLNWLAAQLASIGGTCGAGRTLVRPWCNRSEVIDVNDGLFEMRDVAVVKMPEWTEVLMSEHACNLRQLRFSIMATDPCLYGCRETAVLDDPIGALANTSLAAVCDGAGIQELICGPMPVWLPDNSIACVSIPAGPSIYSRAATVTIAADTKAGPFAIEVYGALPDTPCADVVGDTDLFIGRVCIGRLEAGQAAMIDGASQQVFFRSTPSAPWEANDTLLLFDGDEFPCFPRIAGCDDMIVAIRPAQACVSTGNVTMQIESVLVMSCTVCG